MAYKVIILYQLYMPSYFLGTFTEYPYIPRQGNYIALDTTACRKNTLRVYYRILEFFFLK